MSANRTALWTIRIAGIFSILLGIAHWVGVGSVTVELHMLFGVILVAELWVFAALGLRAGTGPALPAAVAAWGVLTLLFGLNQTTMLPGAGHVIVQIAHVLVGLGAIGFGEALAVAIRRASPAD